MNSPRSTLNNMFYIQTQTLEKVHGDTTLNTQNLLNHYLLAMFVETGEVIQNTDWKMWRESVHAPEKALEELIDVQKFLLNVVILLGYTAEDFIKMFNKKSLIVFQRLKDESGK